MVYPLIGHYEYYWQFVGADILSQLLYRMRAYYRRQSASNHIELRLQTRLFAYLKALFVQMRFLHLLCATLTFHSSLEEAQAGN
jgi:23S rRNA (adenine1618-N6)-methyltransferase